MSIRDIYFTREELAAAWLQLRVRRPDCTDELDTVMAREPITALCIRCCALATRRARERGSSQPRAAIAHRVMDKGLAPPPKKHRRRAAGATTPRRPDAKQRAANDMDLFEENT